MIIVTGGAGFIGSNLVRALNHVGREDLIVVDDLSNGEKFRNIADCVIADYLDIDEFRTIMECNKDLEQLDIVFHQGACSDTTEQDGRYMMDNNYRYSKELLHYCLRGKTPFIYASSAAVYGASEEFIENEAYENPVNVYAYSKLLFDNYVRRHIGEVDSQVVGLRYFNVYGQGEAHKGAMASVAYQLNRQLLDSNKLRLFEGSGGYGPGEQQRDFVHVDDAVAINMWFMQESKKSGIFNVGTGAPRSFNDVAKIIIEWQDKGQIEYISFPEDLKRSYQSFTKANLTLLRSVGCSHTFKSLESGLNDYLSWLNSKNI